MAYFEHSDDRPDLKKRFTIPLDILIDVAGLFTIGTALFLLIYLGLKP
jgi:hypothetical protein